MRSIVISETERHPVPHGILREGDPQSVVVFFGLHNDRGENVVYSTRVTDKFYDVLSKYDLVFYGKGDDEFQSRITGYRRFVRPGVTMDMVGVAFHIRKMWDVPKYTQFVKDVADSLEMSPSEGKDVQVNVKPVVEPPPPQIGGAPTQP